MVRITFGNSLTEEQFKKVCALIAETYGPGIFTCPGKAEERIRKCPDCFVLAWDGDRVVGSHSVYPVTRALWERALTSDTLMDDEIGADCILPLSKTGPNILMLMDVVVHPDYQGQGIANRMLDGFHGLIRQLLEEGYELERFFGFTISSGGAHIVEKNGGRVIRVLNDGRTALFEEDPRTVLKIAEDRKGAER